MNCASFQRPPAYNFFNVALKRAQLQEVLYGKHQQPSENEWKNEGMLWQKIWANLSQDCRQMLQIEINPFPNAISLSLSLSLSLSHLFWWVNPLPYYPQCLYGETLDWFHKKKKQEAMELVWNAPSNGTGLVRVNVSGLYFSNIYGIHCSSSLRLRVRLTLLNHEGKLCSSVTFLNLF